VDSNFSSATITPHPRFNCLNTNELHVFGRLTGQAAKRWRLALFLWLGLSLFLPTAGAGQTIDIIGGTTNGTNGTDTISSDI
jgi:hypothetical protein